ncbi:MAG: Hsp20 family protein [Gammaproteobacteria bacterium]|nr:Hsp20 family protein [Gammaproteobacteria bacterium]
MALTRYDPFKELRELTHNVNSLNDVFNIQGYPELNFSSFVPDINTREGEFAYHIDVDLPGMSKDEINIHIDNNILTISGERKTKEETKKDDYYKIESSFGKFERTFSLPDDIDAENIHAESSDGVLEIVIPKMTRKIEQVKKIEIK